MSNRGGEYKPKEENVEKLRTYLKKQGIKDSLIKKYMEKWQ